MKELAGLAAGVIFLGGFVPYIRAVLREETEPAKASWIIWASLDSITLAGMWAAGTLNGQIVGAVIGAWAVAFLAFFYGKPGWTRLDLFCLGGAILGVALWWAFASPIVGVVTSVTIVFLAAFPTFRTGLKEPEKEDRAAWTLYWISCVLALMAVPSWTLADAAQPVGFMAIESIMMILLWRPRPVVQSYRDITVA
jgi:hypothetical protein